MNVVFKFISRQFYIFIVVGFILLLSVKNVYGIDKISVKSPDNKIEVNIVLDESITYSVFHSEQKILDKSKIGLELASNKILGDSPKLLSKKEKKHSESITAPFYHNRHFDIEYNELDLKFKGDYGIKFRVYNSGVAYRFYTTLKNDIEIKNEIAEFNFDSDYKTYLSHTTGKNDRFAMAFQNTYSVQNISKADTALAFLPATIDYANGKKLTILESDLEAYPGMFLQSGTSAHTLKGVFAPLPNGFDYNTWRNQKYVTSRSAYIAKTKGTRSFPWRVLAISENDTQMPLNKLVYALASPNRIGNYSWVQAGKSAWEWWNNWGAYGLDFKTGINTETYKHYIDFASRYGLEYVILDEGWYNPAKGDMMTVIPEINLPQLIEYAKDRGVGIILWTVFNVLDKQLDEACQHYSKLGVKGFKIDFLDRDDQEGVEMVYRIAEKTAAHKLFLDLHGVYKPTGLNRTYPHIINFEGVFGLEEVKWSTVEKDMPEYNVTFPYIRMMAGPVDFTPGAMRNATKKDFKPIYNNPMSQGTRCHQLAMYIVYDSPLTMLCDAPTLYDNEPEITRFIASIPVDVDETRILSGEMGQYIVSARRKGTRWYIGGLSNWTARNLQVDLSFLDDNKNYKAVLYKDGVNADKQASDYKKQVLQINKHTKLNIQLASGGGFALSIEDDLDTKLGVTSVPEALGLNSFYKKYLNADGIPIVSSDKVSDEALIRARKVISQILSKRNDLKNAMIAKACKVMIIGEKEEVCELPEYAHICNTADNIAYWNKRARGFGGSPEDDCSASCGEENVICLPTDRYKGESILVHEFAHIIHTVGIVAINPNFDNELERLRLKAIEKGLWKNTYCITNKEEYFAETVQSFFNCNRFALEPNGVHNAIDTRGKLKMYDPDIYNLLIQYFDEIDLDLCDDNRS